MIVFGPMNKCQIILNGGAVLFSIMGGAKLEMYHLAVPYSVFQSGQCNAAFWHRGRGVEGAPQ